MKLNNLTKGVVAFSVLSMLASGALMASAANDANPSIAGLKNGQACGRGQQGNMLINNTALTDAQKADLAAKKAEMDAKQVTVKAALAASDYNAWVTAVKAMNANCPLLTKITADNFPKYAEAMKLSLQSELILKDLGIEGQGMGMGMGMGMGGFEHGLGKGENGFGRHQGRK